MAEKFNTVIDEAINGGAESLPSDIKANEIINDTGTREENTAAIAEEKEVDKLKQEIEQYKDKYLRLVADFENYKRRNAKEKIDLIQTAGKDIIMSLLDVLDDCDRAEKQMNTSDDIQQVREGVQLVFNKLRNALQSKGVRALESVNTVFDVEKHEAITEIEVPEKSMKGKVIDEIVKGYYLNDKLIRFAKVVVGK